MGFMKYCRICQDYYPAPTYPDHMKQHNVGMNSDAQNHKQYTGFIDRKDTKEDYMICVLHQKKTPCPVKDCNYHPFGMIRKSWMMSFLKTGYWQDTNEEGRPTDTYTVQIPIDMNTRTVVLKGVPIKIKA